MSQTLMLRDVFGSTAQVPPHGGAESRMAEVIVPPHYHTYFPFAALDGRLAKNTVQALTAAVERLGTTPSTDYWERTPGNAGALCAKLVAWARIHPNAKWRLT